MMPERADRSAWPALPLDAWKPTYETLHRWTQIVGKIRLALTPWTNHSWHATLYVTARGLTTSPIAWQDRTFTIDFDFIDHRLIAACSDGASRVMALAPMSVAEFHDELFARLAELDIHPRIFERPNELPDDTPFPEDREHRSYDDDAVRRLFRVLSSVDVALKEFRTRFAGKSSPVHFFWGSFDLAVTRFSGRRAPPHPGGFPHLPDRVTREAYSHEVSSCGWWPGGGLTDYPAFYAYAYPGPEGYAAASVVPKEAFYDPGAREFFLPYDAVRQADDPRSAILEFCRSTYEAAATTAAWDRAALECSFPPTGPR
jgi:hypothetical protein